jgi:hypothetical protein
MERVKIRDGQRVRFRFVPQWEGPIQGYATNYITRHQWRMGILYGPDDLLQEAWDVFRKVEAAYPTVVEPRHFMALYKTALRNHFTNLAVKRTRQLPTVSLNAALDDNEEGEASNPALVAPVSMDLDALFFKEEAPAPVKRLIKQLVEGEVELKYQWKGKLRETTRDFLSRVSGYNSSIVELVLHYIDGRLTGETHGPCHS